MRLFFITSSIASTTALHSHLSHQQLGATTTVATAMAGGTDNNQLKLAVKIQWRWQQQFVDNDKDNDKDDNDDDEHDKHNDDNEEDD